MNAALYKRQTTCSFGSKFRFFFLMMNDDALFSIQNLKLGLKAIPSNHKKLKVFSVQEFCQVLRILSAVFQIISV